MIEFGVQNLRRLKNVRPIGLRPINVLVGRNSSGKSTFLRAIPLLRQSIATRTRSPILWYGEDVDFGSFEGAVYANDSRLPISFSFGFDQVSARDGIQFSSPPVFIRDKGFSTNNVAVTISVSLIREVSFISKIILRLRDIGDTIVLSIGENGSLTEFTVNEKDVSNLYIQYDIKLIPGSILPLFVITPKRAGQGLARFGFPVTGEILTGHCNRLLLSVYSRKNQSKERVAKLAQDVSNIWPFSLENLCQTLSKTGVKFWERFSSELKAGDHKSFFDDIKQVTSSGKVFRILDALSESIRQLTTQVMYIGPARARSERYYRFQELSVSQIDAGGQNFPMFLNSLPAAQLADLSRWVNSLFGYGIEVRTTPGHISIELVSGETRINIVDTGYGVSQILPVLGQIWWAHVSSRRSSRSSGLQVLAIEQPELHLHPAHQALLADAVVGAQEFRSGSKASARHSLCYLIETHSETFVNRLGELIASGKVKPEDVQILLFEEDKEDKEATSVSVSTFDSDGTLVNWPYGFFQPNVS